MFACYRDLWKTKSEKRNIVRQNIISNDGCTPNCIKLRIDAKDKSDSPTQDKAIAASYGDQFIIPLDFEMLDSEVPYYQSGPGNRLCYEIMFNDYTRVINSSSSDATYKISDISLEHEIFTQPDLARRVSDEYQNMALQYDRILRQRQIPVNMSDTTWNWSFNMPCRSLKGILVLSEDERPKTLNTSKFYSAKIEKVSVIVEGRPNQLYAQGKRSFEQCDEICKYFTEGKPRGTNVNEVQKHLQLHDLSAGEYQNNKYASWLNFRAINKNALHGTGRRIENALEGITLQIEKKQK